MLIRFRKHFLSPPLLNVEVWHTETGDESRLQEIQGYTKDSPYQSGTLGLSWFASLVSHG